MTGVALWALGTVFLIVRFHDEEVVWVVPGEHRKLIVVFALAWPVAAVCWLVFRGFKASRDE